MKVLCLLALASVIVAESFDINLNIIDDMNRASGGAEDRTIICGFFSQSRCTAACAGQTCTNTCTADCGFGRVFTYTCSAIAATTCVAATTAAGY